VSVLRDGLLEGRAIALAGGDSVALRAALEGLGARVEVVPSLAADEGAEHRAAGRGGV
jgi:hypothetical protein